MKGLKFVVAVTAMAALLCFGGAGSAAAAEKIGVIDVQKILRTSKAGKSVLKSLEGKMAAYKKKFQSEGKKLKALQVEIQKKSSAWSAEKLKTKRHEFQKAAVAFQQKQKDAQFEMKQAEDQQLAPLLQKLQGVVKTFGKKNGYAVIVADVPSFFPFVNSENDVTEQVMKAFDKAVK